MRTVPHSRRIVLAAIFVLMFAAQASAGGTSLLLTGYSGDYISGGQTHSSCQPTERFPPTRITRTASRSRSTRLDSATGGLNFAAAGNEQLTPGVYTNAVRWPFHSSTPGLSVYGDGRGCNTLTGSFEVKGVVYGTDAFGKVSSFVPSELRAALRGICRRRPRGDSLQRPRSDRDNRTDGSECAQARPGVLQRQRRGHAGSACDAERERRATGRHVCRQRQQHGNVLLAACRRPGWFVSRHLQRG